MNHAVLIDILCSSGIGDALLSWFGSFLDNRPQWVKLNNTKSYVFYAVSGVPQGGHLSPLLFSLFINSAHTFLQSSYLLCFADDMILYCRIKSLEDCLQLQKDLDSFSLRINTLGLELNVTKCHKMTFTRCQSSIVFPYTFNGTILLSAERTVHDLGFTFSPSLNSKTHINMISCQSLKLLGFI